MFTEDKQTVFNQTFGKNEHQLGPLFFQSNESSMNFIKASFQIHIRYFLFFVFLKVVSDVTECVVKCGIVSIIEESCKSGDIAFEKIYDKDINVCDDGAIYYTGDDENVYDTKKIRRGCCC